MYEVYEFVNENLKLSIIIKLLRTGKKTELNLLDVFINIKTSITVNQAQI